MNHFVNTVSLDDPLGPFCDQRFHRAIRKGEGLLRVAQRGQHSAIVRCAATSPMRLFMPRKKSPVPHVYTSSYGGGLLAGDQTELLVQLDDHSRCVLSSQASTKIYKNPRKLPCSQTMHATVGRKAMLVVAPEPITCFAESQYDQVQRFDIADEGNLVLIDWVTSGRYAVGERFLFTHYQSRQSIYYQDRLVIEDAVRLCPADGRLDSKFRMGHYNCAALMILMGEQFRELGGRLLEQEREQSLQRGGEVLTVAQPLPHEIPGALVRVLSVETQDAKRHFEGLLQHIDPILGSYTWAGKL